MTTSGLNWGEFNGINTTYSFPNCEIFINNISFHVPHELSVTICWLCDCVCLQGQYRKAISSLHQMAAVQQPQPGQQSPSGQASLEHHRALIQQASCHYALGEYRVHTHTNNNNTLLYRVAECTPGSNILCYIIVLSSNCCTFCILLKWIYSLCYLMTLLQISVVLILLYWCLYAYKKLFCFQHIITSAEVGAILQKKEHNAIWAMLQKWIYNTNWPAGGVIV